MDDSISRQAAIEALRRAEALTKAFGYHNVIETIRDLPTADIDLSDYSDRLWRNAYEQGRADAEPRWIPVAERVPEVGTYIVTGRQKYDWEDKWHYFVDVAYCPGNYVDFFWDTFNDWDKGQETHIIAWMPLPEPWKGEDDA